MYIHVCLDLCLYLYLQTRYILPDKAGIIYISYSISLPESCMPCVVCLHIYIYIFIAAGLRFEDVLVNELFSFSAPLIQANLYQLNFTSPYINVKTPYVGSLSRYYECTRSYVNVFLYFCIVIHIILLGGRGGCDLLSYTQMFQQ